MLAIRCLITEVASAAVSDACALACLQGYYDNRYWTMWKLPMFGCNDPNQVLREVSACTKAFPNAYVRLVSFDPIKQVQSSGFLVQKPSAVKDWKSPENRSVGSDAGGGGRGRDSYGGEPPRRSSNW
jgi:hypothetical protein